MPDIFRLSGRVDVETGRAEANLRRVDTAARRTGQGARQLAGDFDRAGSAASMLGNKLSGLGSSLSVAGGNLLSGAISKGLDAITGAMTDGIKAGIEYNKLIQNSKVALESLGMSSAEATKHLAELEQLSLKTPFEYQDVIKATLSMNAFGFSAQTRIKDLTALSDAAAIAAAGNGRFGESFQGIITAIGQMRAKGKVSAEEMNQLAERGIPAWDILAKKVGITKAELMKLGEQGRLKGDIGARLLTEGLGEYAAGASDRLSRTISGKESNARDFLAKRAGEDVTAPGPNRGPSILQAYENTLDRTLAGLDRKAGQGATQAVAGRAGAALDAASQIATDLATGDTTIKEIGKALPQTILDTVKEVTGIAKTGGAAIWQGLSEGFTGALEGTKNTTFGKVSDWASGLIKSAKDTLGIKSPSTVFAEIGLDTARGFNLGLENGKKAVKSPVDVEEMKRKAREELKKLRSDPAIKAMLDTIASAEGAGYSTLFGGGTFDDFSAHPNQRITRKFGKGNITSTAAGRYQFLNRTWQGLVDQYGFSDFSPENQDLGAIALMRSRGMLGPIGTGDIGGALTAGNREWASLPGSPYGQPTKKAETLIAKYTAALEAATGGLLAMAAETKAAAVKTQTYATAVSPSSFASASTKASASGLPQLNAGNLKLVPAVSELAKMEAPALKLAEVLPPLPPAMDRGAKGMDAVTKSMGGLAEILTETEKGVDRFGEAFGRAFDDLLEGRPFKDIGKSLLRDISGAIIGNATGGKYNSPGGLLGGMLSGALGLSGGGSGGAGGFATGGFAGGGGAGQYLGGGGKAGGLIEKGLGFVGNLFNKGSAAKTGWGSLDAFTGATKAGGGLLGKLFGGGGGFLGKLFGGGGAGAAGAGGGKGLLAALGFSNPISAIVTGGLMAAPFIAKLFGKDPLKDYRNHIRSEYGVDVQSKSLLNSVMQLGQSKFGANYKQRQLETVRMPETREMVFEYAGAYGLKGNSRLFSAALLQDPLSKMNVQKRAMGGPVTAGRPYIWNETPGEVMIPSGNGYVLNRQQAERALSNGGGNELAAAVMMLVAQLGRIQTRPAHEVVEMGLERNPRAATRAVESDLGGNGGNRMRRLLDKA
jgi:tape measure domain-containing protein